MSLTRYTLLCVLIGVLTVMLCGVVSWGITNAQRDAIEAIEAKGKRDECVTRFVVAEHTRVWASLADVTETPPGDPTRDEQVAEFAIAARRFSTVPARLDSECGPPNIGE